jgi:energy-coupling factor transporter transmembrane protein EcfT
MIKLFYILSIFFFLIILHSDSFPANLDMQIATIFEDYHKQGHWLPLRIVIDNDGENLAGDISVTVHNKDNKQTYITPISILGDSGGEKYLYIRPDEIGHNINVRLTDRNDKILLEKETNFGVIPEESKLIAIVDQNKSLDVDNAIRQIDPSQKVYIANIIAEKLPDKWKGYDSVDAVILGSFSPDSMSEDQKQALIDWVCAGGILIISGGSDSQNLIGSFIEPILPVKIKGTKAIRSIPSIAKRFSYELPNEQIVMTVSELVGDSKIIITEDNLPIISERRLGTGKIVFISYDYADPIFKSWNGNGELWGLIIGSTQKRITPKYESIFKLLSANRRLSLPAYKAGLFLLLYILCMSIIGYMLFEKRKSNVWIVSISITVLFIIGAFVFNYVTGERSSIVRDFSIVNVNQNNQRARIRSFFSPFSSGKTELKMMFNNADADFVENPASEDGGTYLGSGFKLVQDDIPQIIADNTKSLRTHLFYGELFTDLKGKVLIKKNNKHIEVFNNLPFEITDCYLFWNGSYAKIGTVSPNNQSTFSLNQTFSGNVFDSYSVENEEMSKFINLVKPLLPDRTDKVLVGWADGSALGKLAGMDIKGGYKALGKLLLIGDL